MKLLKIQKKINFSNKKVVAIANYSSSLNIFEDIFAFIYYFPKLYDRKNDIKLLVDYFLNKFKKDMFIKDEINIDISLLDLSDMKKFLFSLQKQLFAKSLSKSDIKYILKEYFLSNLNENSSYKDMLSMFEVPLLEAGLTKYKSQLQLTNILKINRNTLRKKINEYNI